ncbi:MAG: lactate racemase domain-containing protein [Bacillota bacterium]
MEGKKFRLPQNAWFGDAEVEITLPAEWQVELAHIPADALPPLREVEIAGRLLNPTASPPLSQLAGGRRKAVIIFDDLSRPTMVDAVAPLVIEELLKGGMREENISFVAALGAHGAHTLLDFTKKLGEQIVGRFPVYNHNPYEHCSYVGQTSSGIPIYINNEVLSADLKIGIGSILPHAFNGFGGGGKIVFPGVAGMESIYQNHRKVIADLKARKVGFAGNMGDMENSRMKEDIEEVVRMIDFNFKIDLLPNSKRQAVEMVAGDPVFAHRKGVKMGAKLYLTDFHGGADIVIANANAKANEALIALLQGAASLKESGGDLVLIVDCPAGQVVHYLLGQSGAESGGKLWSGDASFPPHIQRGILFTPNSGQRFGLFRRLIECHRWQDVLELLQEKYSAGARVVVYKDGTMQYFRR